MSRPSRSPGGMQIHHRPWQQDVNAALLRPPSGVPVPDSAPLSAAGRAESGQMGGINQAGIARGAAPRHRTVAERPRGGGQADSTVLQVRKQVDRGRDFANRRHSAG
uniref:(northern house mosquito) hypothetical protein n=1 Tax=Culex pipiens TaxID=7175 RepID=A0A8D8IUG7_CULPI